MQVPSLHFNPQVPGATARVILRRVGDRQIFVRPPVGPIRATPAMLAARRDFKDAVSYCRAVFQNQARRAAFEAKAAAAGAQVFATIMSEFAKNPVLREVNLDGYRGRSGDVIAVRTRTDLSLANVHVRLRQADDTVIEEGDAVLANGEYRYTATQAAPAGAAGFAEVTVRDTDGVEVKRRVPLTVR